MPSTTASVVNLWLWYTGSISSILMDVQRDKHETTRSLVLNLGEQHC